MSTRRDFLRLGFIGLVGMSRPSAWLTPTAAPLPPLRPADGMDGPPVVSARAWAVADGATGRLLWGGNEAAELAMASTTKVMTAHVVLRLAAREPAVLDETLVVSQAAAATVGSSAQIRTGDRVVVRELLYGLLLPSGNDAAAALAEHFGPRLRNGDMTEPAVSAFVSHMNRTAAEYELQETRFFDPHGLGRNHTSTRDLTKLAWHAMQDPAFRAYVRTRRHFGAIEGRDGTRRTMTWNNTNRLLEIDGYEGIKTGTTTAAGSCLVGSGRLNGDHVYVAVLGCTSNDSRYVDTRNLFRWAWAQRRSR